MRGPFRFFEEEIVVEDSDRLFKLRADNIVWRQVGDEVMVLDTASSEYLSVNLTGSALWALLLEGSTLSSLSSALVERFGVDQESAMHDASAFLSSLEQLGLLQA
jgi:hypothetical protein